MSTRSMVGKFTDKNQGQFTARYCHYDGYPSGVGQTIINNWRNNFDNSGAKIADFLLSTKYGWSVLNDTDFTKPPGWDEKTTGDTPRWYDDREGEEPSHPFNNQSDLGWIEYAYLFDTEKNLLCIYQVIGNNNLQLLAQVTSRVNISHIEDIEDFNEAKA